MNVQNVGPCPDLLDSTPSMKARHGLEEVLQPAIAMETPIRPTVATDPMVEKPDPHDVQITYRPSRGDKKKLGLLKLTARDSSGSSQCDHSSVSSVSGRSMSVSSQGGHSETSV